MSTLVRKAYVLKTDGAKIELAHQPTLEEAQKIVGGYVEKIPHYYQVDENIIVLCNEDGIAKGLELNQLATELLKIPQVILGNVLVLEGWKDLK